MKLTSFQNVNWIIVCVLILGLILAVTPVSATIFIKDGTELDNSSLTTLMEKPVPPYDEPLVVFFYDPECGACSPIHDYIDAYLEDYPDTYMEFVNLANGAEPMDRFKEFKKAYNREKVFIPVIYIGPVALEGKEDIENHFDGVYTWYMNQEIP